MDAKLDIWKRPDEYIPRMNGISSVSLHQWEKPTEKNIQSKSLSECIVAVQSCRM